MNTYTDEDRDRAQRQFLMLNLLRIAALGFLLTGIAITQAAINAPYWAGIIMVVIGLGGFFFGPPLLARRFKAGLEDASNRPDRTENP